MRIKYDIPVGLSGPLALATSLLSVEAISRGVQFSSASISNTTHTPATIELGQIMTPSRAAVCY